MSRSLASVLFVLGMTAAMSARAEVLRIKGNELFCQDRAKFPEFSVAAQNNESRRQVEGCRQPHKGTRYKVLEEGVETGIDKVHLYDGRRPAEGYLLVQSE